jgi:tRNA (cmo5U34)-methyltransferase
MSQFHFHPDDYLELMHAEVPGYDELQDQVSAAATGLPVERILELGTGTGETARRLLRIYPEARLTGVDASEEMLAAAKRALPPQQVDGLLVRGIQEPLPEGPFDLAVSALTVHHLDGRGKAQLFGRLSTALRAGGRFVMGDVIVPDDPRDVVAPLSADYDMPSRIDDLLGWLAQVGFDARVAWQHKDLAVIIADRSSTRRASRRAQAARDSVVSRTPGPEATPRGHAASNRLMQ